MRTRTAAGSAVLMAAVVALAAATITVLPSASAAPVAASTVADLRADVDRNGVVDITGTADEAGEQSWSPARGAVFLANVDDDSRRCPKGGALSDAQLQRCSDATDSVVNGATDAADLARLRTVPMPRAGARATATVAVSGAGAARHTRVFLRSGPAWKLLEPATKLSAGQLRAGVELGIEATDVIRDTARWNGLATVKLTVTDGARMSSDAVVLKVAPLLTHHPLQRAQRVMVNRPDGKDRYAKEGRRFVRDLETHAKAAGVTTALSTFSGNDVWVQDFVEPAYMTMPGAGGKPVGMRVLLRSPQNHHPDGRPDGVQLYRRLRGPGVGVVEVPGMKKAEEWSLSSMGNLEKIPPYRAGTTNFPHGRVVMGWRADTGAKPAASLLRLLTAQEGRAPLLLDTSFLRIGHLDEILHFVPANTPRGWRAVVADPDAAMALVRAAAQGGAGGQRLTSKRADDLSYPPDLTVAQALANRAFVAGNRLAADKIEANVALLQRETGLAADEIVRVPVLFRAYGVCEIECDHGPAVGGLRSLAFAPGAARDAAAAGPRKGTLAAFLPSAVNGVLLAKDRYLAPKQFGPLVNGKDVFADAVTAAYRAAGITVTFVDDWNVFHVGTGNIHCGTNLLRAYHAPWWAGSGT
jgi:protein-arginine deiminase